MSLNELYVIVSRREGVKVSAPAFRSRLEAEEFLKDFGKLGDFWRIERYLPAPLKAVGDD